MSSCRSLLRRGTPLFFTRIQRYHRHGKLLSSAASQHPIASTTSPEDGVHMTENCIRVTLYRALSRSTSFPAFTNSSGVRPVYVNFRSALQRMKELHAKETSDKRKMLRLSVETGGCSGFQYVFGLDEKRHEDDRVFEKEGVKLVVDNISYDFVKGATVDYVEELIRSSFLVTTNPSAVGGCSCKSSFMVK